VTDLTTSRFPVIILRMVVKGRATFDGLNVYCGLPSHPVNAAQVSNLSAGVSKCNVLLGRPFDWRADLPLQLINIGIPPTLFSNQLHRICADSSERPSATLSFS
jgi:hypothetical protein